MLHVKINPDLVTSVIWGWSLADAGWTSYGQKVFTAWKWLLQFPKVLGWLNLV